MLSYPLSITAFMEESVQFMIASHVYIFYRFKPYVRISNKFGIPLILIIIHFKLAKVKN